MNCMGISEIVIVRRLINWHKSCAFAEHVSDVCRLQIFFVIFEKNYVNFAILKLQMGFSDTRKFINTPGIFLHTQLHRRPGGISTGCRRYELHDPKTK